LVYRWRVIFAPFGYVSITHKAESSSNPPELIPTPQAKRIAKAFAAGQAEGLFLLAAERREGLVGASFRYWREFAARYLTALCHVPETTTELPAIPPPDPTELAAFLASAPPMQGAEDLTEPALVGGWKDLDTWVRGQIVAGKEGLSGFLKRQTPLWYPVGRVCFHLAENRCDKDYPFAFLATYAPGLTGTARIQYQPLSQALREMAGARTDKPSSGSSRPYSWPPNKVPSSRSCSIQATSISRWPGRPARPIGFSKTFPCSRKAGSWCECPTGGRNVPGRASA